jgi:hypothetical protein
MAAERPLRAELRSQQVHPAVDSPLLCVVLFCVGVWEEIKRPHSTSDPLASSRSCFTEWVSTTRWSTTMMIAGKPTICFACRRQFSQTLRSSQQVPWPGAQIDLKTFQLPNPPFRRWLRDGTRRKLFVHNKLYAKVQYVKLCGVNPSSDRFAAVLRDKLPRSLPPGLP